MPPGGVLPEGTVTFLFTDIERSTETVETLGDESYADVLESHRALLREAFAANGGHEIGTEGDAFFVAFGRAGDAVAAAIEGQRSLQGHRLRVRIGLHTGEALVRGGGYIGQAVHKAKRVSDAGHGGQILVSQATAELVRDGVVLTDLGPHRLKDLAEPQRLYQVGAEGLEDSFPPLRTLDARPHNIPVQLSTLVGRDIEVKEVADLVRTGRLVTLTGAAGCGKTRLALHVASDLLSEVDDGAFLVELAPIADGEVVLAAAAAAVGVREEAIGLETGAALGPSRSLEERLIDFLRSKELLLIIDNCEHVIEAGAKLIDTILRNCARVRVLATSREPLGLVGEATWRVPSLSVPEGSNDFSEIVASDAVKLFVDRAPVFTLTPEAAGYVAHICSRLDGIPLAIELAAARVPMLSPQQIAERLDDRFRLLTGGARTALERQQTLRAAVDWSYALLDERERTLLRRVTVFAGGFDLSAAENVCADDEIDASDVLELLTQLYRKSLVLAEDVDGAPRYRLLETIRQYAREKLFESDEGSAARDRHLSHFAAMAMQADTHLWGGPEMGRWLARFETELDNVRAALDWGTGRDEALRLASHLGRFWLARLRRVEGTRWIESTLAAAPSAPDATRARALVALGQLVTQTGDWDRARELIDEARTIYARLGDASGSVNALRADCFSTYMRSDYARVRIIAAELLAAAREQQEPMAEVIAYVLLGRCASFVDGADAGARQAAQGLRVAENHRTGWGVAMCCYDLGLYAAIRGEFADAVRLLERSIEVAGQAGNLLSVRTTMAGLGAVLVEAGENDRAEALLLDAIKRDGYEGEVRTGRYALISLAQCALVTGRAERAATLAGAAEELTERYRFVTPHTIGQIIRMDVEGMRAALGDEAFERAYDAGRAMELHEAVAYALGDEAAD